ncbi:flavodoxin domain-containing protein [Salisediminibacterium halotolerans]|uniref:Menaquinone-dependent protoporphyrinogen oxidase n=1 Tax=Salisediminibacterium halotolerans TaxID=517425 RepID=A0A1H9RS74_9BACI|nr:flavodoxin domain-containing protein [Salisediminibacterium haloalkalitolerans]SER75507.1 menaquinone-dependent protoporphyrinogen oxidase [Salisediminibacterium haloalkalitolerans]
MSVLIVYSSTHGTTEKAAMLIRDQVKNEEETVLINIKQNSVPDLDLFDKVIIGASIHMGAIPRKMRNFLYKEEPALMSKTLGLFLCCLYEDIEAQLQFERSFPETLREHAVAHGFFGGELLFEEMNMFEKMIAKKVSGSIENVHSMNYEAIDQFIAMISETKKNDPEKMR